MATALNRKQLAELFRPTGPKYITTVNFPTTVGASSGGTFSVIQAVDLTLPLRGFRFIIKGRISVATANYTSVNPESILNLLTAMLISGINRRQGGNATIYQGDLATLFALGQVVQNKAGYIQVNGVQAYRPGVPVGISSTPNNSNPLVTLTTAGSPYDFVIVVDYPFAPFGLSGNLGALEIGYIMRQEEWKDSVTFKFTTPTILDNSANALGTSAATTVTSITAFGSGAGTPTIDIYSLPIILGSTRGLVVPGILSRNVQPINTALFATTTPNVELLRFQKQMTPRIFIRAGVGTVNPIFTSFSDTILSAFGIQVGTDRNVRDTLDLFAHRSEAIEHYDVMAIQGHHLLDFMQMGNPDSSYPGDQTGDGAVLRLVANTTNTANGQVNALQEQIIQKPEGPLFS
jgi:hypothetical protein